MRQKKLVLASRVFVCPATNKPCLLGAVLLIKAPDIMQMPLIDDDQMDAVRAQLVEEEAERHG